jgi:hypothetical protein
MRAYRLAIGLILAALVTFTPWSIARAARPDVLGPVHDEGVSEIADCGSFTVLDRFSIDFTLRFFYDKNGNLVRLLEHVSGTDTFINSVTGKAYPTRFHNTVHIDPATGLGATTGVIYKLTVPGSGAVFMDVGRIVTNQAGDIITFQAGKHQFFSGDFAGLCRALG